MTNKNSLDKARKIKITLPARLTDKNARLIIKALSSQNHLALFVGGCVRDSLLHRPIFDIDIATTATPQQTIQALKKANIQAIPSGIEHGTITAITKKEHFEITTLRKDILNFGRHAKVAFCTDWQQDAQRRDFTMNALYADLDGNIYDFFDGIKDAHNKNVKFIGSPGERIKEDYLRILRYFRFYATHGTNGAYGTCGTYGKKRVQQQTALEACRKFAPQMKQLSIERIGKEMRLLLNFKNPINSLRLMHQYQILENLPNLADGYNRTLINLIAIDSNYGGNKALRRFTVMLPSQIKPELIAKQWKLKNSDKKKIALLMNQQQKPTHQKWQSFIYHHRHSALRDCLLQYYAKKPFPRIYPYFIAKKLHQARKYKAPIFPLQGKDLLTLGYEPGPHLGKILKQTENWWLSQQLKPNKNHCIEHIKTKLDIIYPFDVTSKI